VRLNRDPHDSITLIFDMAEVLYLNGARNFIYMTRVVRDVMGLVA